MTTNRYIEPTPDQQIAYHRYLATVPSKVRLVANRFDVWTPYRIKSTRQLVLIYGWDVSDSGDIVVKIAQVKPYLPLFKWNTSPVHVHPDDLEHTDTTIIFCVYDGDYYCLINQ